jgi:hypothetical protein
MFGRNAKSEIDSLIGISARIEGDLCFTGGLRIDGEVHGNVIASDGGDSVLIVSEHARIEGEVRCANLVVNGISPARYIRRNCLNYSRKAAYMGCPLQTAGNARRRPGDGQADPPSRPGEPVFHLAVAAEGAQHDLRATVYNGRNPNPIRSLSMTAVAELARKSFDVIPSPIVFTDSAAQKVAQLIEEEGNPDLKLRVFVQGGGCSGFQYGFTFDEIVNEDDTVMEKNGVSC